MKRSLIAVCAAALFAAPLFEQSNLIAWCIVPFDAKKRGPEERAQMLKRLGITKFVYDWRDKDIPSFDAEIDALQKHHIALQGFWTPHPADPAKPNQLGAILDLIKRRNLRTELWLSLSIDKNLPDDKKLEVASAAVARVAAEATKLHCRVGLYNHGGWFGEPENQIAIIDKLKLPNVGIVYNFHHGHDHIARFPSLLRQMLPHLYAININGMKHGQMILPVGDGEHELEMLRAISRSGYKGPIGILGHRAEIDAEEALSLNLRGLKKLLPAIAK